MGDRVAVFGGCGEPLWCSLETGNVGVGAPPSPVAVNVTTSDGSCPLTTLTRVRGGQPAGAELIRLETPGSEPCSLFPWNVLHEAPDLPHGDGVIVVQHRKRDTLVGSIRYVEIFSNGRLAVRQLGVSTRADVLIDNSMVGMLDVIESETPIENLGTAIVRGRTPGAMMALASAYSDRELLEELRRDAQAQRCAVDLGRHFTAGALEPLVEYCLREGEG